jgi:hypothetical protein
MAFLPDSIIILNLILCTAILIIGCAVYRKNKDMSALLIGIAFGLFGLDVPQHAAWPGPFFG